MGLRVDLSKVPARPVRALIEKSWRHSAPRRIVDEYDKRTSKFRSPTGPSGVRPAIHRQIRPRNIR